jgi:hypothetical protein
MKQKRFLARVLGVPAMALALAATVLPGMASAQPEPVHHDQAVSARTMSSPCGFYRNGWQAWYNHCGPMVRVWLAVQFSYGADDTRYLCLTQGDHNLSDHPSLQGGWITWAESNGAC